MKNHYILYIYYLMEKQKNSNNCKINENLKYIMFLIYIFNIITGSKITS